MTRNISMDIFGRDKLPAGLENKQGAGSYERDMTTLYVNYGGAGHYAVPQLRHLLLQVGEPDRLLQAVGCLSFVVHSSLWPGMSVVGMLGHFVPDLLLPLPLPPSQFTLTVGCAAAAATAPAAAVA